MNKTSETDPVILNFLDFDGGFKKEPDGLPAFEKACPHDASNARFVLETLASKQNLRDRQQQRATEARALAAELEGIV